MTLGPYYERIESSCYLNKNRDDTVHRNSRPTFKIEKYKSGEICTFDIKKCIDCNRDTCAIHMSADIGDNQTICKRCRKKREKK